MPPKGTAIAGLGRRYYITMGAGLAISLVVILVTLPLLTGPASMRFEQAGPAGRQRLRAVCFRAGSTRRASGLGLLSDQARTGSP